MKTRNRDTASGFGFEYKVAGGRWCVAIDECTPRTWPTAAQRDAARACFTHRRSVTLAQYDLARIESTVSAPEVTP